MCSFKTMNLPSPVVCVFSRSAFTDRSQTVCDVCTWQAAWDRRQVSRMMYKTGRCGQKDQTINLPVICLFLFIFCFFQLWPHAKRAFGAGSRWKRCLEAGGDIFTRDSDMCVFYRETACVLKMAPCCQPGGSLNGLNRKEYRWFLFSEASEVPNTNTSQ